MPRILVIDDNENIRETLGEILAICEYEVSTASNGIEALEVFAKEGADLIITDLIMPEKGGIDLIKDLKKTHPEVKIFAVSGGWIGPKEQFLKTAGELGALRTFTKPVNWDDLRNAVKEVLPAKERI